ncbi:MAG: oligopeptide transporter, OPT family [Holophaga sp.]|nr:oligopeptide transporter, OPT family [Holophaga sp.]
MKAEAEASGLSKNSYGGCKGSEYVPYVPTTEVMPEITGYSIIMGILFALLFAAANTYLGLKVGMTISAGIPGAILAIGLLRRVFKRNFILEANMVASLAAMGESIAGGIIFVLPALLLLGFGLSITTIVIVTIIGGLMGDFFITPVRRYLIVEEHGTLIYPESMAAAEVLVTGTEGGGGFRTVLMGMGVGSGFKLLSGGFGFWSESASYTIRSYQGTMVSLDAIASLMGVGFIVGTKTSMLMFGGSVVAWLALIPLLKLFGAGVAQPLYPSTVPVAQMDATAIWSNYIRYVGAGAVAAGGFISLLRSLPTIVSSFKQAAGGMRKGAAGKVTRMNHEAPLTWVIGAAVLGFLLVWFVPVVGGGPVGSLMAVLFSFFFAVVSGRMVGLIGASNNPVSGMTIAALLIVTTVLKLMGNTGSHGMTTALMIGGVTCIAIAVAGGTAQSLKTTFIIGGNPRNVQAGMFIALSVAAVGAAGTLMLLNKAYGIGSIAVPAPQATLMKMIVQGIMTGQLPWTLVLVGVALALFCFLMDVPILAVALGIYLPIGLTAAVFAGGLIRTLVERKGKAGGKDEAVDKGILLASGIVAGDALMGIVVGLFAALGIPMAFGLKLFPALGKSSLLAVAMFLLLGAWMYWYSLRKARAE